MMATLADRYDILGLQPYPQNYVYVNRVQLAPTLYCKKLVHLRSVTSAALS
jgi:hypothetical protein